MWLNTQNNDKVQKTELSFFLVYKSKNDIVKLRRPGCKIECLRPNISYQVQKAFMLSISLSTTLFLELIINHKDQDT